MFTSVLAFTIDGGFDNALQFSPRIGGWLNGLVETVAGMRFHG